MLELLAIGLASLTDRSLLVPRRRQQLPEIRYAAPLPVLHIGNLDSALFSLRDQAWSAFHQLEREAETMKSARGQLG